MNRRKSVTALLAATLLAASFVASPARADLPRVVVDLKEMDTNKNGRIEKTEYLAAMGTMFDQAAGTKGYCTIEEIKTGLRQLNKVHSGA